MRPPQRANLHRARSRLAGSPPRPSCAGRAGRAGKSGARRPLVERLLLDFCPLDDETRKAALRTLREQYAKTEDSRIASLLDAAPERPPGGGLSLP